MRISKLKGDVDSAQGICIIWAMSSGVMKKRTSPDEETMALWSGYSGLGISTRIQGSDVSGGKGTGENWTPRVQFHCSGPRTPPRSMTGGLKNRSHK
jgi:hypothetical protein